MEMSQVYRCYVEKREGFRQEGERLCRELREQLGKLAETLAHRYRRD